MRAPALLRRAIPAPLRPPLRRLYGRARTHALIRRAQASRAPIRLVLGADEIAYPGWISTEVGWLDALNRDAWLRFVESGSVAAMLAEHVWEYFTAEQAAAAARHCFEFLEPGGNLRVAVPDGFHPDPAYQAHNAVGMHEMGGVAHKVVYTHDTLAAVFTRAGFEVRLLEHFDAQGHFHEHPWDPRDGMVRRSRAFDRRNDGGRLLRFTSIILDARKPR